MLCHNNYIIPYDQTKSRSSEYQKHFSRKLPAQNYRVTKAYVFWFQFSHEMNKWKNKSQSKMQSKHYFLNNSLHYCFYRHQLIIIIIFKVPTNNWKLILLFSYLYKKFSPKDHIFCQNSLILAWSFGADVKKNS